MSYILDALRKSQREREPATPGPHGAVHNIAVALPVRGGLIIIGIVLLLAMLGAAWFFWRSTLGGVPAPVTTVATVATVAEPRPVITAKNTPPGISPASSPAAEPVNPPMRVHDLAEEAMISPPAVHKPKPAMQAEKKPLLVRQPVSPLPVSAASTSGDGVPFLQQMPLEFQHALPALAVTIHVYAPDPSQRILFINNREYHEGGQIAGGIRVEAIVPDGAVLSYQGERFKLGRPR
ncbi:MAG TPA: general secretion pathway protein GspB [Candidatus Methylomirabilis sp.]|nr:general secretion pathway protein GspB [Candidatus Methylomirabilis sp.]